MADLEKTLAALSPEKRRLLELKLKQKGAAFNTFPLSYAQQRLWFIDQMNPGNPAYNIPVVLRLKGQLNEQAFHKAIETIIQRHESLRTTFSTVSGKGVQVVHKESKIDIEQNDLSQLSEQQIVGKVKERVQAFFNLGKGPLGRISLFRVKSDEHILVVVKHHIISDGWSMGVLVNEFSHLYNAFAQNREPDLPALKIQYADYAKWQREWLSGERREKQMSYWKGVLRHVPVLQMPTDFARPATMTTTGATVGADIDREVWEKLRETGRSEGATDFMVLLSVYAILLMRASGQKDFCIGTPVANRNRSNVEGLIGFFVNMLALRLQPEKHHTFRDVLKQVKQVTLDAFAHQDMPFEMLVEEIQPERSLNHTPIFQTTFSHTKAGDLKPDIKGLEIEEVEPENFSSKFDLALATTEMNGRLLVGLTYNSDLWSEQRMGRFAAQYVHLAKSLAQQPDKPCAEVAFLSAEEKKAVLGFARAESDFEPRPALLELFEESAATHGAQPAVVYEDKQITFSELRTQSNKLAHYLLQKGVAAESRVAVLLDRSVEIVSAILATWKAGAAYVPVDPNYPAERVNMILEDAQPQAVLTTKALADRFELSDATVFAFDDFAQWPRLPESDPAVERDARNSAYVIFTSGSTGRPKGVVISDGSLLNLAENLHKTVYEPLGNGPKRISLNAPIAFDASVQQLVMVCYGHQLHILPQETRADGAAMVDYIREHKLQVVDCVPVQLRLMLNHGLLDGSRWRPEAVLPGGEAIDEQVWKKINSQSAVRFYNVYGPTECSVDSSIFDCSRYPAKPVIGRSVSAARYYILDASLQLCPIGTPGELYIAGNGLARGYLGNPAMSAEKFLPDPFAGIEGARMYASGDRARWLENGFAEVLGRVDSQVKVRGFRIELGEIESALQKHETVKHAAVVARKDDNGTSTLLAYLEARGKKPDVAELRAYLRELLPDYMVPAGYVILEKMPLTPNGKIDRRALPDPTGIEEQSAQYVAPRDETEQKLAVIFAEILKKEKVGATDNFFDLGGHSLLATQLVSKIRDVFKAELSLQQLFENPVVEAIAREITSAKEAVSIDIPKADREKKLPLSYAQQRLWFLYKMTPESAVYNIPMALRLKGQLDISVVERVISAIAQRHDILRTTFIEKEGQPVQSVGSHSQVAFKYTELSGQKDTITKAKQLIAKLAATPFDLENGPLGKVKIMKVAEDDYVLAIVLHHIISDGWSSGIFEQEFIAFYSAFSNGRDAALPQLEIQYADYAAWQRETVTEQSLAQQIAFWEKHIGKNPPRLNLPADYPRPEVKTTHGEIVEKILSKTLLDKLRKRARELDVTPFMFLMSAFFLFIKRYSGQDDFTVGTPVANRPTSQLQKLIGFFVNTIVLRRELSDSMTFSQHLRQTKELLLQAQNNQDVPFEMLVNRLQPERSTSHSPLFQVMYMHTAQQQERGGLTGLQTEGVSFDSAIAKFDLTLSSAENPDGLGLGLEYSSDLFEAKTARHMLDIFSVVLEKALEQPDLPLSKYALTSADELQAFYDTLNHTWQPQPLPFAHVVEMLAQHAKTYAENTALVFGDDEISYADLNRRANRLAHYLLANGAGPDTLIGLCFERHPQMVVALLAVLKAGAAYVPLDPAYPQERLAYMIGDSAMTLLLAHNATVTKLPEAQNVALLNVDDLNEKLEKQPDSNPDVAIDAQHLAYMIYTSGSTGRPKGTMISHGGLLHYLSWTKQAYPLDEGRGSLLHSTIAFDATVTALYTPLLSGKSITLAAADDDLQALGNALVKHGDFNVVKITPAHLDLLSHQLEAAQAAGLTRAFVIGGENLDAAQIAFWRKHAPQTHLFNEYGPTETVVGCVVFDARGWDGAGSVPIGRAIPGSPVYVLDAQMQPLPPGVPGELYIGGNGVARGYHGRAALTADRFLPDPFSGQPGARMYKTGDLVRWLNSGQLIFLGRIDEQVKIRGYRIELGEIETALKNHEQIREAVVIARKDDDAAARLAAYYISKDKKEITVNELRGQLKKTLPEYMLPATFTHLEKFPLTPNGKIDLRNLPKPSAERAALETDFVAPRSEKEKILADAVASVLKLKKVGVYDNFFELGGDSIMAIQVISRARKSGLQITPLQMFQNQTVAELAAVAGEAPRVDAEQGEVTGAIRLTPIMHTFFEKQGMQSHWNQSVMMLAERTLQREALERTLQVIIRQHDALRLRFSKTDNGISAEHEAAHTDILRWIDLSGISDEGELKRRIEQETETIQASLNISEGPLLRAAYFDCGNRPDRLLLVIHHLVVDGVSWRILMEDFQLAYAGKKVELTDKTTSFKRWSEVLHDYALSGNVNSQKNYWLRMAQKEKATLPLDNHSAENSEAQLAHCGFEITKEETTSLLKEAHKAYNTQINDLLLTALLRAYARWSGKRSLLLHLEGHGREMIDPTVDVSRTVGWFTSIYPLHLELGKAVQPGEQIRSIKEQIAALPGKGLGFGLLRYFGDDGELRKTLSALDDIQVLFNYLGQFDQTNDGSDTLLKPAEESRGTERAREAARMAVLDINSSVTGGQWRGTFSYSREQFLPETIKRFADAWTDELRVLLAHCKNPQAAAAKTASDFKLSNLDNKKLDKVLKQLKKK